MQTFQLTPPNTCSLVVDGASIVYVLPGNPSGLIFTNDSSSFSEFLTPEDAAVAALAIDPSYDVNFILGPLTLDPVDVTTSPVEVYVGADVTLNGEFECTDPTATLTYSWSGPTGDLGVTESSLTIDNVTEAYDGSYTCTVGASNASGQTGSATQTFQLTVTPAPNPSGVINTGRSGSSPQDLAPSYFTSLSNMPAGVTEAQLELYIPGTDTVIPYNAALPSPFRFDSFGDCYNPGDYRTVIRVASTGDVLATVYPSAGPNRDIFWLYNPVVPS